MADKIKVRRGLFQNLPNLDEAEFGLATDTGTLYIGTEDATNILINPVLAFQDGYSIDGYLVPAVDNVHNLGTPDNRWHSVFVGPGTISIVAKDSDAGQNLNKEFKISVDADTGTLQFTDENDALLMVLDSDEGVSFPSGGGGGDAGLSETVEEHKLQTAESIQSILKDLDGYQAQINALSPDITFQEFKAQQSQVNQSVLQSLDGYQAQINALSPDITFQEFKSQQNQINQSVVQSLDGYASVPNTAATGDGYLVFYTGVGRNLAGDNDLYWNRETKSLGIGTQFPNTKLTITGSIESSNGVALNILNTNSGNSNQWFIGAGGSTIPASAFSIGDSGDYRLTIDNSGMVGIATTGPVARLEVEDGAMTSSMVVKITHDDHNVYGLVIGNDTFSTTDTDGLAMYVDNSGVSVLDARGTASRLSVQVGGTDRIRITNTGLVGLSTATPQNRLDVEGAAVIGATYAGTNTAPTNGLLVEGNIGIGITSVGSTQVDVTQSTASTVVSGVDISNDSTGDAFIRFGLGATRGYSMGIDNSDSDSLKIGTAANTGSGVDTGTLITLTTGGLLGVGTTTPQNRLDVEGAVAIGATYSGTSAAPANGAIIEGNVGIGIATPDQTLHVHKASAGTVNANSGATIVMENNGNNWLHALTPNTAHAGMLFGGPDDSLAGAVQFNAPPARGGISLVTGANLSKTPLVASVDGLVGIRTSTPIEALTVAGSIALQEQAAGEVPVAQDGYGKIYVKTDNLLYYKNDLGNEGIITTSVDGADGYIAFYTSAGALAGDNDLFYDRVNGFLSVTGGMAEVQVGDTNFRLDYEAGGGGVPGIFFDSGDRIRYSRSTNSWFFDNSTTAFSIGTSNNVSSRHLIPGADDTYDMGINPGSRWRNIFLSDGAFVGDTNFGLNFTLGGASIPGLAFDSNDNITYDRSADILSLNVGGTGRISINNDGYVQTLGDTPAEAATQIRISGSNAFTSGIEFYTTTTARRGFVGWRGTSSGSGLTDTGMYLVNFDNTPLFLGTSSTNRVQITATDGYVGINGTPGPAGGVGPSRLQIFADAAGESMFSVRDGNNGVALEIISPATSQLFIRGGAGDNIHFGTNGSNDAAITVKSNNEVDLPGFVAYASVTNLTDSTANSAEYNPFASASHAAYVENTNWQHNTTAAMVVFTPADGRFTVERTGVYSIECVVLMTQSATGILDNFAIRLNGSTTIWVAQPFVHSSVDPVERSINFYSSLSVGDYLELLVNSSAATTLIVDNGTTFNMRRIG